MPSFPGFAVRFVFLAGLLASGLAGAAECDEKILNGIQGPPESGDEIGATARSERSDRAGSPPDSRALKEGWHRSVLILDAEEARPYFEREKGQAVGARFRYRGKEAELFVVQWLDEDIIYRGRQSLAIRVGNRTEVLFPLRNNATEVRVWGLRFGKELLIRVFASSPRSETYLRDIWEIESPRAHLESTLNSFHVVSLSL
jgi:hypothetical protein